MYLHFHKVPVNLQDSFSIRHDVMHSCPIGWHYHPELELHYTIKGEGIRLIGDNISNFYGGDILLLGENLPHSWRCREEYFQQNPAHEFEAIVIHFLPGCLGNDFLNLPEALLIPKLFEKAQKGMVFQGKAKKVLAHLMLKAINANLLDRLIVFLSLLKVMAETKEYDNITTAHPFYKSNLYETERINEIFTYTLSHYKEEISLEKISSISHLSITSFCRYFKLMTKKTYKDFLYEIRVSHACRLLIEDKKTTDSICFECGFNNISNFYRHFKKIMRSTPLEYKRKYLNGY